ncbi:MAG TPA: complex I NDUFA9 subunit family protein [Thermoanaerobaculaceae bacterium]|nr:complex I NDUFA9 subunit family protein [Thermoanaerobaculaceae bacterium]
MTRPASAHHASQNSGRRVLLTGARGFVGREIRRQLLESGWEVVALSRTLSSGEARPGVIQVCADAADDGWQRWCEGCSAAIHLVGIIREAPRRGVTFDRAHRLATERVITVCRELGISRLVHMSALGARAGAATEYHRSKWRGEEAVKGSGLDWTVFRPSTIFGPGDGFTTALAAAVRRFPIFPVFGSGTYRVQPISVAETARCFVAALGDRATIGQAYELGGPEALEYNEVVRRVARALGVRRTLVHIPLGMARLAVSAVQHFPGAPITRDQLTMLLEGSTCDTAAAGLAFSVPHARFEPAWLSNR